LNESLWSENIEIPIEQQELVLGRMQKSKENPERLLDWDMAVKTIKH
jgi:DNA-directed RNA polymerase